MNMRESGSMKTMKKMFAMAFVAVAGLAGCQQELIDPDAQESDALKVYATIEDAEDTKTYLNDKEVYWSPGDRIAVFMRNSLRKRFDVSSESVGSKEGVFVYDSDYIVTGKNVSLSNNVAYYPFAEVACTPDGSSYLLENVSLPSTQSYSPASFGQGSFPMVAVTSDTDDLDFAFKNLCGVLAFQLKGSGTIRSIAVKGNSDEILSGKTTVTAAYGKIPAISLLSDGSKSVTLDCGETGVALQSDSPTAFYIVLPPVSFDKGFTVTVTDASGTMTEYSTTKKNVIHRSGILRMPEKEYIGERVPQEGDYIDEYGVNHGPGVKIGGTVWAPVNCGYHKTDFKYGKLYQWGRKYGQGYDGNIYDVNGNKTGTYSDASVPTIKTGPVSLSTGQSKSNEKYFYITYGSDNSDWLEERDDELWNSGDEDNPVKTEYDPCPDGWRVPTAHELSDLKHRRSSWTTNNGQAGYWFSGPRLYTETEPQVFFPAAGSRNGYDGTTYTRCYHGHYWSSSPNNWGATTLDFDSGEAAMYSSLFRDPGYSVRCVQEGKSTPPTETPKGYENLSANGTANSYIVSEAGNYKFETVKGVSSTSVGTVSEAEVLWESYGTTAAPSVGDLVKDVSYSDGYILFSTADTFREGNAVIAAKNSSGEILWSWHIWLTDQPKGQMYYNNAGTMMDRDLGATSATPGDVGVLGLFYQWGRKDPFLSITGAKSTGSWPSAVSSSSKNGTIDYAVKNPMVFITYNSNNSDWYYSSSSSTDNTRWQSKKTIYDPCPAGWRVPDGGTNGTWFKSLGWLDLGYISGYPSDSSNKGMDFSGKFGNSSTIWYPFNGYRDYDGSGGTLYGYDGNYWSVTPYGDIEACSLRIAYDGYVFPSVGNYRAYGYSVRCLQE